MYHTDTRQWCRAAGAALITVVCAAAVACGSHGHRGHEDHEPARSARTAQAQQPLGHTRTGARCPDGQLMRQQWGA